MKSGEYYATMRIVFQRFTECKKTKEYKLRLLELEDSMSISYNRLWKLLIDKKMSVAEMRKSADIAPNTVTRMKKDQEVTMAVLEKICGVLDADFGDIVEYKK